MKEPITLEMYVGLLAGCQRYEFAKPAGTRFWLEVRSPAFAFVLQRRIANASTKWTDSMLIEMMMLMKTPNHRERVRS